MLARGSPWRRVLPGRLATKTAEGTIFSRCRSAFSCDTKGAETRRPPPSASQAETVPGEGRPSDSSWRQASGDTRHGPGPDPTRAGERYLTFFRNRAPQEGYPLPLESLFSRPCQLNSLSHSPSSSLPSLFSRFSSSARRSRSSLLSFCPSTRSARQIQFQVFERYTCPPVSLSQHESSSSVSSLASSPPCTGALSSGMSSAARRPHVPLESSVPPSACGSADDTGETWKWNRGISSSHQLDTFPKGALARQPGLASLVFSSFPQSLSSPSPSSSIFFLRRLQIYPQRRVIGHRIEIFRGKHRRRRMIPPRVPLHPLAANTSEETASKDMNLFETYRDLQLRWKKTCRQRKKKFNIARKWRMPRNIRPLPDPSWTLVFHVNPRNGYRRGRGSFGRDKGTAGAQNDAVVASGDTVAEAGHAENEEHLPSFRRTGVDEEAAAKEEETLFQFIARHPEKGQIEGSGRPQGSHGWGKGAPLPQWLHLLQRTPQEELFCVMKSNVSTQHKVTAGDLIQAEKLHRKQAGDKVVFGTVLLVGSRDWTIIGKPTVPFAKVEATVEEQTLAGETLSFFYRKSRRVSRFRRIRHCVTMLRVDRIVVDPTMAVDPPAPKPDRLLDLWANRWLYPDELEGVKRNESGEPVVSEIYDGREHQKGSYQRRGLTASYRWYPDPQSAHWRP